MNDSALLIVITGGQHYAVARAAVRGLARCTDATIPALAARLGVEPGDHEWCALRLCDGRALRVAHVELSVALPQLPLPRWIIQHAHPAIQGVVVDQAELIPVIDLTQL